MFLDLVDFTKNLGENLTRHSLATVPPSSFFQKHRIVRLEDLHYLERIYHKRKTFVGGVKYVVIKAVKESLFLNTKNCKMLKLADMPSCLEGEDYRINRFGG